jgi:NAD(P)H-flavin reductase
MSIVVLVVAIAMTMTTVDAFVSPLLATSNKPANKQLQIDSVQTTSTTSAPPSSNYFHFRTGARTLLFMGWGPEPIWSSAQVKATENACKSGSCVSITMDVSPETAAQYTVPGQYIQLRLNEEDTKPLFLAIASPPNQENASFEFLIKKTDGNEWITASKPGQSVDMSQVLGKGFPIDENLEGFKYDFPTQNVLLFAAGSGIAPIKAAIESGQLNVATSSSGGRTARLYYGVQNPEELCFVESFGQWEQQGFQIVPVLSQPPSDWEGRTGYVQAALEEDGVPIPRNSGALLCGMKGMAEAVKDILMKAGVFEGRVLTNF